MRLILLLLFPIFLQAQIQRAYGVIEIVNFPTSSATGPKFAYRPADSSFYRWVSGSTWIKIIPDEPDTLYLRQLSGTTALVDGDTIDISTYLLKADTASMLAAYIKLVGYGLIKTGQTIRVDTTSPNGLATRKYTILNPTAIGNRQIAHSNGSNLIGNANFLFTTTSNLLLGTTTDVPTSIFTARSTTKSSSPFPFHTTAESNAITGVNGNFEYITDGIGPALSWYNGTRKAYGLESTFARGTATRIPFFDANGQITENVNFAFNTSTTRATIWTTTAVNQGLDIGTNPTAITAPLVVTINAAGRAFILANSSTEYTDFISGGVEKGMRGTGSVPFVLSNTGDVFFRTAGTERGRFTSGGLFGIGVSSPSYFFELNSTGAMGLTRGTTAQRPSVVTAKTPFRYNTDSTDVEFGESSGIWRMLADREYVRSFVRTGANPSASIGLSAVNGSATTYMRSDAAPALSQAIRPTWTDRHRFADTTWIDKNLEMDYASKIRLGGTSGDYSYGVREDNINGNLTTIMHSFSQAAIGFTPDNAITFSYPFFFDSNGRARFNADSTNSLSTTLMNGGSILVGYDTTEAPELKSLVVAGYIGQGTLHPSQELDISGDAVIRDTFYNTLPVTHSTNDGLAVWKSTPQGYALGKAPSYYLARDTFIEDVTLFSVGTMMYDCQELTIVSSMTVLAPSNQEIRFPDASDLLRGKKIIVYSKKKDSGAFIPQIKVVGGVSRLYFTTNSAVGGTDPSDQSTLSIDDSTWSDHGTTFEFTCLKIDNTPSYRWVLKQR
jgi:hypothetical protein